MKYKALYWIPIIGFLYWLWHTKNGSNLFDDLIGYYYDNNRVLYQSWKWLQSLSAGALLLYITHFFF